MEGNQRERGGGRGLKKDELPVRPQESTRTSCARQQRSQGGSGLHPYYKRVAAVTRDAGLQRGSTALSHSLSFTLAVHSHHGRDTRDVVLDHPPETP